MLNEVFTSPSALGWGFSLVGIAAIFCLAWPLMFRRRKHVSQHPDETLLGMFDELHAAIIAGKVTEAVFLAWVASVPRHARQERRPEKPVGSLCAAPACNTR